MRKERRAAGLPLKDLFPHCILQQAYDPKENTPSDQYKDTAAQNTEQNCVEERRINVVHPTRFGRGCLQSRGWLSRSRRKRGIIEWTVRGCVLSHVTFLSGSLALVTIKLLE